MKSISAKVYRTDDYDMFKRLEGNRSITKQRVRKIKTSILKVGYVMSPIIINEKCQVIDGQGRLEALKELGLPVDYVVVEGAGIKECVAMNINQGNWTIIDYIDSYAEIGNTSYMYMKELIKNYGKYFKFVTICNAITGLASTPNDAIKNGYFECSSIDYSNAVDTLTFLMNFKSMLSSIGGRREHYYSALSFCYGDAQVNNNRLVEKMNLLRASLIPVSNVQQAFDVIETIYNNRAREKVYIKTNYKQYLDGKYSWYSKKYGNKYEKQED